MERVKIIRNNYRWGEERTRITLKGMRKLKDKRTTRCRNEANSFFRFRSRLWQWSSRGFVNEYEFI